MIICYNEREWRFEIQLILTRRNVGIENMYLAAGLGNPGRRFKNTRHNTGFYVVEKAAGQKGWRKSKKGKYLHKKAVFAGEEVLFIKPQTFMNNSGVSLRQAGKKYGISPDHTVVIHDEADLELGQVKISRSRGAAGHKGVASVIEKLGANLFLRIRVGIGKESTSIPLDKWVLGRFSPSEKKIIEKASDKAVRALQLVIKEGAEKAMTEFNAK